jgi:hypothetical protein
MSRPRYSGEGFGRVVGVIHSHFKKFHTDSKRLNIELKKPGLMKGLGRQGKSRLSESISDPHPNNRCENVRSHSQEQQKLILEIATRALENGNRDLEQVFAVAENVGTKAHLIENLRAYATRALFRVRPKPHVQEEQLIETRHGPALSDSSYVERIEAQILVRELLDGLAATDREIFVRSMNGESCPEIDAHMNLKPRTAEIRLRVCKNALRRAVQNKLKP